jgi:hypothetical protein
MLDKMKAALVGTMIIGSGSVALARETVTSHLPHGGLCATNTACLPWQAPIGHRQPGAADFPRGFTPVLSDPAVQAVDKVTDRTLTICRGC